ncbi:MAG: hypothetical protein RLY82_1683 [Pseudomonadota bacterium]|jgi:hypothetical protein
MGFLSTLFGDKLEKSEVAFVATQRITSFDVGTANGSRILAEIDLDAAIAAHMNWKGRLTAYLSGASQAQLCAEDVCQDELCPLGQWLYGPGRQSLGGHVSYPMLVTRHKQFHAAAAKIITLRESGDFDQANAVLNGDYSRASHHVICLLKNLKSNLRYINL